jgi:hypothetical protein
VKYLVRTFPVNSCSYKMEHTDVQCVVSVSIADCVLYWIVWRCRVQNVARWTTLNKLWRVILNTWKINVRRVMELQNSQFLQISNLYKTIQKLNVQCNICLRLFFLYCNFDNSSTLTTNVCDNNKQYLLHFSAAVVITNCARFILLAETW